jgi:lysophospholipid acyltransferase
MKTVTRKKRNSYLNTLWLSKGDDVIYRRITEKPTLLEVFSFIFFYPSCLIGPSFEFKDYLEFLREEGDYENIPYGKCNKHFLYDFILALINMGLLVVGEKQFEMDYAGTDEYANKSLLYRWVYYYISCFIMRVKYYSGWKLSTAALNLSGFNYQKKEDNFNRVECNISKIELTINPRTKIIYWNRTVHFWLKYYVYMRIIDIKVKPLYRNKALVTFITFLVSAVWHGFYLTYYIFFLQFYLLEQVAIYFENRYELFTKMEKSPWPLYIVYWILGMSLYSFYGMNFGILRLDLLYNFNMSFYFVHNIFIVVLFIYTLVAKNPRQKKQFDEEPHEKKE